MRVIDADTVKALAPMPRLIDCLEQAFKRRWFVPERQTTELPGASGRLLLSMPAFDSEGCGAVKLVTLFPDNASRSVPTIRSVIVAFSETGMPIAVLDGTFVTKLRTGATSALASRYLSRLDSANLLIMGTGALAPYMALAHSSIRPLRRITVWGRNPPAVARTVGEIKGLVETADVRGAVSAEAATAEADIVSCATSTVAPILLGKWLKPGTFVDLVGSFSPTKREADDDVMLRSRIFVDTRQGALSEAGDLLSPILRGVIGKERVEGELSDLISGRVVGRKSTDELIVFKSVGSAMEDLVTVQMVLGGEKLGP
jgi:alanine dehydrogenase